MPTLLVYSSMIFFTHMESIKILYFVFWILHLYKEILKSYSKVL